MALSSVGVGAEEPHRSHLPTRPLPVPTSRAMDSGPSYFLDPVKGDDRHAGTREKPWKTVNRTVKRQQGEPQGRRHPLPARPGTIRVSTTASTSAQRLSRLALVVSGRPN
jgi:hypothetical protein